MRSGVVEGRGGRHLLDTSSAGLRMASWSGGNSEMYDLKVSPLVSASWKRWNMEVVRLGMGGEEGGEAGGGGRESWAPPDAVPAGRPPPAHRFPGCSLSAR